MTREIVNIDVQPGREKEWIELYRSSGRGRIVNARGCLGSEMYQSSESPSRFVVINDRESAAAHREFSESKAFGEYAAVAGPFFAGPPSAGVYTNVLQAPPSARVLGHTMN